MKTLDLILAAYWFALFFLYCFGMYVPSSMTIGVALFGTAVLMLNEATD